MCWVRSSAVRCVVVGLALAVQGCMGGQTGEGSTPPESCDGETKQLANTKVSPLGFSAEDILQLVEASQGTVPAYWPLVTVERESGEDLFQSWSEPVADASTQAQLHLQLTPRGSKSKYVAFTEGYDCDVERLEIPVDVEFELENDAGTLSTKFKGTLLAPNSELAVLNVDIDVEALRGDPQLGLGDTEALDSAELALQFTPNGVTGALTVSAYSETSDDPGEGGTRSQALATWPQSNPCLDYLPVLFGEQLGPVDPSAAIQRLEQGAIVYWEDGTSSEMTLAVNTSRQAACFEITPFGYEDASALWASSSATVDVKTADGRWDAGYQGVQVEMSWAYSGDSASTHLTHYAHATQKQLQQLGFSGLELNGEEADLSLHMVLRGEELEGVVQVTIPESSGKACKPFESCETTLVLGRIGDPTLEVIGNGIWY